MPVKSPVNAALLLGCHSVQVGQLQKAFMEVVQVNIAHQQEGGGDEDSFEEFPQMKML